MGLGLDYMQISALPARSQRLRFRLHLSSRGSRTLPVYFIPVEKTTKFQMLSSNYRTNLDGGSNHHTTVAGRFQTRLRLRHLGWFGLLSLPFLLPVV